MKYNIDYLDKFIETNALKDKLSLPMRNLIKSNVELVGCRLQMQEQCK